MQICTHCSIYIWGRVSPTSGAAAALVRGSFADAALGTLGTAHGAAGAAAFLARGAFAVFAFAGAGTRAGPTSGAGAVGIHGELKRRLACGDRGKKEAFTMDREVRKIKQGLGLKFAELVYTGA